MHHFSIIKMGIRVSIQSSPGQLLGVYTRACRPIMDLCSIEGLEILHFRSKNGDGREEVYVAAYF